MPVPETPVYENNGPVLRKNQISPAGKILSMKTEAVSHAVKQRPDGKLGFCVLGGDAGHIPAAALRRKVVGHQFETGLYLSPRGR